MTKSRTQKVPGWFALANVLSTYGIDDEARLAARFSAGYDKLASEIRTGHSLLKDTDLGSETTGAIGNKGSAELKPVLASAGDGSVTVAEGGTATIAGRSDARVTFAGSTGALKLDDPQGFAGVVSGLSGKDAIDLSGFAFGAGVKATFLGDAQGGVLTVTDGAKTARIALSGDYLSSTWTLASDGKGGTTVVDPPASTSWQDLKVGGGGYATGLAIAPDGSMVIRTDTNGAYLWNGSQWTQLVTSTSLPAAFLARNPAGTGQGVYEIQMAPSNSSIMYMMFDGYVFKSANKGTTWTQTSFAPASAGPNDNYRMYGQKMAVDPSNPNIVYAGTSSNGLFVSKDGGQTWGRVSAIPAAGGQGITGILFDPAAGGAVNGATQTLFASSYGAGVYQSVDGGASWTKLSGGPSDVEYAAVSSAGVYYAVGNGQSSVWSYANGTWTQLPFKGQGANAIAVNPANPNELVVANAAGYLDLSYDGGKTWTGPMWDSNQLTSADIPWLAQANNGGGNGNYLSIGGLAFNPTQANQLVMSGGTGVWTTTQVPTSGANVQWNTPVAWQDMSAGIENLVANEIIAPPGGKPVLASWDRPFFTINNPDAYPSTYGPVNSDNIVAGWSVDYASSNPSFIVGLADWWGTEQSGYSADGGQTWTKFATEIPGAGSSYMGGTIAASTPQNIVWAPADGNQAYYTLNGGASWSPVNLPGVTSWGGFDTAYYLDTRTVTADRVSPNTFYLYYPGQGVFKTTNGGASWTNVHAGYINNAAMDGYNAELQSVPGAAGNLFFTGGPGSAGEAFFRSTDGGASWTKIANVTTVSAFGFGAAASGQSYPAIYIVGYVNNVYGIWQSTDNAQSWTNIGAYPVGELDAVNTISGDMNTFGQVYVGFAGGGYAYLPAGGSTGGGSTVTVANYLANKAALDSAGNITIADTAANVSASFDALNADTHITSIAPAGSGTQVLTLTVAQSLNDARALSILDPFTVTVADTAAHLQAYSPTQIANLSASGVTTLEATDADVSFTTAQTRAMGAAAIKLEQPYSSGVSETLTYSTNGNPASASYSNGMTETWTYNSDGSYNIAYKNVVGAPGYGSYEKVYDASGSEVAWGADLNSGSGALQLYGDGLTISSSSGRLSLTKGADVFQLNPHSTESLSAGSWTNSETFQYASGFGRSSITGLLAGTSKSDVVQLNMSMFNSNLNLTSSNPANDFAQLLNSGAAAQSGANVTITDKTGDVLTLVGVTTSTLSHNASSVFKFV